MSNEKKVIFDHWNYIDADDFKESIEEWYGMNFDDISDDDKWRYLSTIEEQDYDCEKESIQSVIGNARLICMGVASVWNGNFAGGFIAENLQDAIGQIAGSSAGDIGFYETNEDGLHMTFTHHDGTHDVCVHAITDAGEQYIEDNEYNYELSDVERDATLFTNEAYSSKIYVIG